ncbi:MAG: c-type cytochrome, partial [Planctomycetales bacterium]|nr:c-type cytochrome [Planctomycetales bacterium]
ISDTPLTAKQAPDLARSVGRINPRFLQQFIADPLKHRPGTTMPDVMVGLSPLERKAATDEITHYLLSLTDERYSTPAIESEAANRGRDTFHTVGCVACHSPRAEDHQELLAENSVPLGKVHEKYSVDGLVAFLENPLQTRPAGRMPQLQLSHWEAIDIASYLLAAPTTASITEPFPLNADLAAKGKARFAQLGCQQCHSVNSQKPAPTSLALSEVRSNQGCLSDEQGNWPLFQLSDRQRTEMQAALVRTSQDFTSSDHIALTLTGMRCVNCHQRDRLGGVSAERDIYFHTTNPNLGPQGRIPPTLTGVGAKLNPNWMRQVLVAGRTIRPYVTTRMPQYGADNVAHLVELFEQVDHLPDVEYPRFDDQKKLRESGTELVGTAGLNCIVCHTFQLKAAANMPAVDLTEMAERLKKDWFYHYMRDPQSLSRNTIMPSFWPAGRAMRKDILDGDSDLQIEALWQYLLDGRQARTPRGLIVEPIELLATDEAVMLRRSYPGVGKRGIGVGYPQQVNLVFDAEQLRLAMIWKGKFADPGGVWRSQGHGTVRPLGDQLMRFSPGPDLDDATNPWVVDDGRPPSHQFMGYSLDDKMRPRFRYRFAGIDVEDYAVDQIDGSENQAFLRRQLTFKSDADRAGLTFRAASGNSIVRADDGVFVVDGRLQIHVQDASTAKIDTREVNGAATQYLNIPLHLKSGLTTLTLDYRW